VERGAILSIGDPSNAGLRVRVTGVRNPCATFARGVGRADWVEVFSARNRVGVYLSVLTAGAEISELSSPWASRGSWWANQRRQVTRCPGEETTRTSSPVCTAPSVSTDRYGRRWFAHHDPRDAQGLLNSEIFGNCVIADFTKKYVRAAAHERGGWPRRRGPDGPPQAAPRAHGSGAGGAEPCGALRPLLL